MMDLMTLVSLSETPTKYGVVTKSGFHGFVAAYYQICIA